MDTVKCSVSMYLESMTAGLEGISMIAVSQIYILHNNVTVIGGDLRRQ